MTRSSPGSILSSSHEATRSAARAALAVFASRSDARFLGARSAARELLRG